MKFLLTTVGTAGDLNPFLDLGRALREQGDTPVFVTAPMYRDKIAGAGFAWRAVDFSWDLAQIAEDPALMDPMTGALTVWRSLYRPSQAPTYRAVAQGWSKPSTRIE